MSDAYPNAKFAGITLNVFAGSFKSTDVRFYQMIDVSVE
jgi:hypothetical protein